MPKHAESSVNVALAEQLRELNPRWRDILSVEQSAVFDDSRRRPDLVLRDIVPVVLETEFYPARTVESDAVSRLEQVLQLGGHKVEQVVACRIPKWIQTTERSLIDAVSEAEYEYCFFAGSKNSPVRWPKEGWIHGTLIDVADCLEVARLSESLINESSDLLQRSVDDATYWVLRFAGSNQTVIRKLGELLNQEPTEQTVRMAITILANAFTFHKSIQYAHDLPDFESLKGSARTIIPRNLIECWHYVLRDINYWPIFEIAIKIVLCLGTPIAIEVFRKLEQVTVELHTLGATTMHDLSGRMLQRLITDRKFLATFYTLPSSAALLAELSVARLKTDFSNVDRCAKLKIADFACGTGTLITAAYQVVLRKHRRNSSDEPRLHSLMMAQSLIAADIMPAATHLTASQLSSTNPSITFDKTCVYTMPYGQQTVESGRRLSLGSLDLIAEEDTACLFGTGSTEVSGQQASKTIHEVNVKAESLDIVIMNPPFTRPTNHESTTVPIPSFAGFQTSEEEQRAMSRKLRATRRKLQNAVGDGYAGLASDFVDLAHVKLKGGGVLALVLPLTVLQGSSWRKVRDLLSHYYEDIVVLSLARSGATDRAFSADTGMAEVLIVATKSQGTKAPQDQTVRYVNLRERPPSILAAMQYAKTVLSLNQAARMGHLQIGNEPIGIFVRASMASAGCAGVRSLDVIESIRRVPTCEVHLPRTANPLSIQLVMLKKLGKAGPVHRLVGQRDSEAPQSRGVFRVLKYEGKPSYPILWNHCFEREKSLIVPPDSCGEARSGRQLDAVEIWKTATRLHFNLDFRINSQALSACLTPKKSLGGRAWPSFVLSETKYEIAICLWCNSTLGLLTRWWIGSKQQQGRSVLTVTTLVDYPVLDCRVLSANQLEHCEQVFEEFKIKTFLPANEAFRDKCRQDLDRALLFEVLGLPQDLEDSLALLRDQWCHEPTVHGGKSSRIDLDLDQSILP